jgi:aconitate hydratase
MLDSFNCRSVLTTTDQHSDIQFVDLKRLPNQDLVGKLPYSLKILLENLLRYEDGVNVQKKDIEAILHWNPKQPPDHEIAFTPSRVVLQDFTGVPVIVDLAAMREAMHKLGGDPKKINPLSPVDLVIDHSVMADYAGNKSALEKNTQIEFSRNRERYSFLRWGQTAFNNFRVVPPGTGIVHQVNLEYLASVVCVTKKTANEVSWAYPDTLVGTDSHTTMINGLGVLGWGVGGIEAEAAMLGQPITMLIPEVIGFKLSGKLPEGTTATDLVLTITEILRKKGVVGKFVEFFGDGLDHLPLADRATIANMAPEYGATCSIFPIDAETIHYLTVTGRAPEQIALIEQFSKKQGLFRTTGCQEPQYTDVVSLDLASIQASIAGPKRPNDRINLSQAKQQFEENLKKNAHTLSQAQTVKIGDTTHSINHDTIAIAAITSCTNTSNPSVMLSAGILAKKAVEKGLKTPPWVKTSLAPGSQVVTDYFAKAGLTQYLDALGFYLVGYGCTTCIGNSGPLLPEVSDAIRNGKLSVNAILSGNRNFEGRIHPEVQNAYLASPPLVVAYALAGSMNVDLLNDPIAYNDKKEPVYLKDIWPTPQELKAALNEIKPDMYSSRYGHVFEGDKTWQTLDIPTGERFVWDEHSTYVKNPPYFEGMTLKPAPISPIKDARVLVYVGDSVTTDHISPAGSIAKNSPAAEYLIKHGVEASDFNSYGSRRGNHEVMMRGTFANIRLKNKLSPDKEGNWTRYLPTGETMSIYDAAVRYQQEKCGLIVLAGKEYGSGSSRDWAAKGTLLLGIRAVIAESFERIHRSNLVGMGVLPLQFLPGESAETLGLSAEAKYDIPLDALSPRGQLHATATDTAGKKINFAVQIRIDTPKELEYYQHGGILPFVLRQLASGGN